jgi:HSP20 family protein
MFGNLMNLEGGLFDQFRRMEREMDQLFGAGPRASGVRSGTAGAFPALNVGATPDRIEVYVFAPGVDPNALEISIQQNVLAIAGNREEPAAENARYFRRERFEGQFYRAVTLPEDADPEQVKARCRDGILRITVQRREAARPRQIEVK